MNKPNQKTQTHRHKAYRSGYQRGMGRGEGKMGKGGQQFGDG